MRNIKQSIACLGSLLLAVCPAAELMAQGDQSHRQPVPKRWTAGETFPLAGYDVTLSEPVLVAESKTRHMSMPVVTVLANGDLLVVMTNHRDEVVYPNRGVASFSSDGGLSWTEPAAFTHNGSVGLRLPNGDELMLPFYLALRPDGTLAAPYNLVRKGQRRVETVEGVEVSGWPEPVASTMADGTRVGGFGFDGQAVTLEDGSYFTTLYGGYRSGGVRVVGAQSRDGIRWKVVGTIARRSGRVNERGEGPTEAALCRLKDGRLMCIYRLDSDLSYGQTWSNDEGRSWSEPVECRGPRSVEPSLAVLEDGTVFLSGGRPGLKLWGNPDGTGQTWEELDVGRYRYKYRRNSDTTGYTELAAVDASHLLYVYDYGRASDIDQVRGPGYRVEIIRVTLKKRERSKASAPPPRFARFDSGRRS